MNALVTMAHICGPLGRALALVDEETWLYERNDRHRPSSNDIRFFFDHGLEIRSWNPLKDGPLTEHNLLAILDLEERRFRALHGVLVGMDAEIDDSLRQKSMRRSNRLLADPPVADFVERRFLRPLPQQAWDLAGARRIAQSESLSALDRLYAIVDGPLLLHLEDEIAVWVSEQRATSVERVVTIDKAYDSGLIATLVTALHDGSPNQARTKVFWAKDVEWDRRLAARLVSRFAPTAPSSAIQLATLEDEGETFEPSRGDIIAQVRSRIIELLDEFKSRRRRKGHRDRHELMGAGVLPAILKQIEWIVNRFESGHFRAGWDDVVELAERQLKDGDPDKLAMSLTSLAGRLARQEEVASALSDIAGICAPEDPAVWTARAELLRGWGRPYEALAAYERTIEDFPQNVVARSGRAETLRSLGRFEEALAAYERTIEDFPQDVVARNGRAETLRSLGRFQEALAAYERIVGDFPQDMFARNGCAVVLGDLGKFDEARAVLKDAASAPRTAEEWVAVHILSMIDVKEAITPELATRLQQFMSDCPYREQHRYFETTLAIVRIALKRMPEARDSLAALSARAEISNDERAVLNLMKAHAEAAEGDLDAARQSLAAASNIVSYEEFQLRQLRREIERRFGLGPTPAPVQSDEIATADNRLIRIEMDFLTERATRASMKKQRAA